MKKITLLISLFIIGYSCSSEQKTDVIKDIDFDFPTTDTITFNPLKTFNIASDVKSIHVKDSVLFVLENNNDNLGYCYSINSGEKISTILNKGRAANEQIDPFVFFTKDSIQFIDMNTISSRLIKTFSLDDIISKPISERTFSVTHFTQDTLSLYFYVKIGNETIFGTNAKSEKDSDMCYFIFNPEKVFSFGKYEKEIFDSKESYDCKSQGSILMFSHIRLSGDKVIVAYQFGMGLNVIDTDKKAITKERYYNKFKCNEDGFTPIFKYKCKTIECDDENIYYFTRNIMDDDEYMNILVFDWELNPIKRYAIKCNRNDFMSYKDKTLYLMTQGEETMELLEYKL